MASTAAVYQAQYYEKNKDKLREKAREREKRKRIMAKAFLKASTRPSVEFPAPNAETDRLQTLITAYAIPPILLISTFLMIREMTNVYAETWGVFGAILVALAIEGFTLLFSFVHSPSTALKFGLRGLAVILAVGSIGGMSISHYSTGAAAYRADSVTERAIADLETAIQRKQSQSDALFAKRWTGAARKLDRQIDSLRLELTQLRTRITQAKPATAVAFTTLFEIFIRFALTICNIVAAHLFGASLRKIESFKAASHIPTIDIGISRPNTLKLLMPQKQLQKPFQCSLLKTLRNLRARHWVSRSNFRVQLFNVQNAAISKNMHT